MPFVVLPFHSLDLAPSVPSWRVRSKIFRYHGGPKFLENDLRVGYDPLRKADDLGTLASLDDCANGLSIPPAFSDLIHTLREHIDRVRGRLAELESGRSPEGGA